MVNREEVEFLSGGIRLDGCFFYPPGKFSALVCIAHGIPADPKPVQEKGYPKLAEKLSSSGFGALIFNFRGTPASQGFFTFHGWDEDLSNAISFLENKSKTQKIFVFGFSAGAAISVYRAARDGRVKGVVLFACPSELGKISAGIEYSRRIGNLRIEDTKKIMQEAGEFSPIKWISKISAPVFIIHGNRDELVPLDSAYRLYESAEESKQIKIVDFGHKLRQNEDAIKAAVEWVKKNI
jgi:hypothetical protein